MKIYSAIILASMKMYYRNKHAIIWSLVFPVTIMLIFGMFNFERYNPPKLGINDLSNNQISKDLINSFNYFQKEKILEIDIDTQTNLENKLINGDIDGFITIPKNFGLKNNISDIEVSYDKNKIEEKSAIKIIITNSITDLFNKNNIIPENYKIESSYSITEKNIVTNAQGFKGFLVPGIAAMAIMQTGLFSVVFTLIRFKVSGVLRRLNVTPIGSSHFIIGQMITRVILIIIQTYLIIMIGIIILGVSIGKGDPLVWIEIGIISLIGGLVFLAMGLGISGWATDENMAAPLTNLIALPMMFLSGVFFTLYVMPNWVINIAQFFPLTFLADSIRSVSSDGLSLIDIKGEILGLIIWLVIALLIAIKTFKWE